MSKENETPGLPVTVDVKAARELCDAATPGPWECSPFTRHDTTQRWRIFLRGHVNPQTNSRDRDWTEADAKFIAASRTLVPALLDEVERLRARVTEESDNRDYVAAERDRLAADVSRMLPIYSAAVRFASATHTFDANCSAGDCDDCPARTAKAELFAACGEVER